MPLYHLSVCRPLSQANMVQQRSRVGSASAWAGWTRCADLGQGGPVEMGISEISARESTEDSPAVGLATFELELSRPVHLFSNVLISTVFSCARHGET